MYIHDFDNWCRQATKGIKYPPDRKKVHWELYEHMSDRLEDFLADGMAYDTAVQHTIQAMGDASELAPMLAAIHRPFEGYLYSFLKWGLAVLTIAVLWNLIPFAIRVFPQSYDFRCGNPQFAEIYNDETHRWKQVFNKPVGSEAASDGYTFTITNAILWETDCRAPQNSCQDSHVQLQGCMKVTNLAPWTWCSWQTGWQTNIGRWFQARDSLGNIYYNGYDFYFYYDPVVRLEPRRTGLFTTTYEFAFRNYLSQEAEWIELYYDRSDRDVTLRIDLE